MQKSEPNGARFYQSVARRFRQLLLGCAATLAICASLPVALASEDIGPRQKVEKPNIVIFIADDMAWDDWGGAGNPTVRTPRLDRLAARGLNFTNAYLTCSSCSPSRCSILTGLYPHNTGAGELHLPLSNSNRLVASYLRNEGYWTAAVGKWHLGEAVADQVDYRKGSSPAAMAEAWCAAIGACPTDKPLFMWAAHSDPHRGYKPGAVDPPHAAAAVVVPELFPDTQAIREDFALYYDEVSRFDSHVGQAVDALQAAGRLENTLIVVMSDNGRPFPHCKTRVTVPGVRTPFVVHWPKRLKSNRRTDLLVSSVDLAPTILEAAGLQVPEKMQGHSFLGLLTGQDVSGENFTSEQSVRKYAFAEHNWHDYRAFERAAISQAYCYVRNWLPKTPGTPPADAVRSPTYLEMQRLEKQGQLSSVQREPFVSPRAEEFLFDIAADPNCTNNLLASGDELTPAQSRALAEHQAALQEWMQETADSFPGEDSLTPDGFDRESGERLIQGTHPALAKTKRKAKVKNGK